MNTELKKCPFCGGESGTSWIPQQMALDNITVGGFAVNCKSCFAVILSGAKTEKKAIEKWNNRI